VAETQLLGTLVNTPPTAICNNFTAQLDASGNVTISPSDVDGGSTDAEGSVILSLNKATFDCSNIGINEVVLTVTDSDGATASCTATVTVEDNIPPIISCPENIEVNNDPGVRGAFINYDMPEASDNCS